MSDYINEIMGDSEPEESTETLEESNEEVDSTESQDEHVDSEPEVQNTSDTEQTDLEKQIEVMQKRINDKDDFINVLREQAQSKDTKKEPEVEAENEEGFWDDPEAAHAQTKQTVQELQFQLAETRFATKNPDYYDVVSVEAVNSAAASDADFAKEFNESDNRIEVAYTYLKDKSSKLAEASELTTKELEAKIRADIMAELKVKPKKEAPSSVSNVGHSDGGKSQVPDDGFEAMFGQSL